MHRFATVVSSYHQCLKGIWAGKKVTIGASERSFEVHEAHLSDAVYITELEESVSAVISRPRRVKIPKWADIKNDDGVFASKQNPADDNASSPRKVHKVTKGGKTIYCL